MRLWTWTGCGELGGSTFEMQLGGPTALHHPMSSHHCVYFGLMDVSQMQEPRKILQMHLYQLARVWLKCRQLFQAAIWVWKDLVIRFLYTLLNPSLLPLFTIFPSFISAKLRPSFSKLSVIYQKASNFNYWPVCSG